MSIINKLKELQDAEFRDFNAKLLPNINKDTIIGIKTPALKNLAKELVKNNEYREFLNRLPHAYFEENQLHAFIISKLKDYDLAIAELECFLPYVDNWATCDQLVLRSIAKNPERIIEKVDVWLASQKTYTVRFAIGILMRYFLNEKFDIKYLEKVADIITDDYYINMMSAWYFATALAKQYDATLPYFTENRLTKWVHNKSIQKARESRRVTDEHKVILKSLLKS